MSKIVSLGRPLAALILVLGAGSTSMAQQPQPARLRATIEAVDGSTLTAKARDGAEMKIHLADAARVTAIVKASMADIKPNSFVGITSVPQADGSQRALEIHIFPEAGRGSGEGQRPWDLGPKSLMTNGAVGSKVTGVDGQVLTLNFKGGDQKVVVPADIPVVAFVPSDKSELKPGNKIIVIGATKGADGAYEASGVNVGRDGLTPPM